MPVELRWIALHSSAKSIGSFLRAESAAEEQLLRKSTSIPLEKAAKTVLNPISDRIEANVVAARVLSIQFLQTELRVANSLYELARRNHSPVEQRLRRLNVAWRSFGIIQRHIFDAKFDPQTRNDVAAQVEQLRFLMNALEQELGGNL